MGSMWPKMRDSKANSGISCEKLDRNVPVVIHLSGIHFEFLWLLIGLQAAQENAEFGHNSPLMDTHITLTGPNTS